MSTTITVATYNILDPYFAVKWSEKAGLNKKGLSTPKEALRLSSQSKNPESWKIYSNWKERTSVITENIKYADIVCLQEISPDTIVDIMKNSEEYKLASLAYHPNPSQNVWYGNAIIYNPQKSILTKSFEIVTPDKRRASACAQFIIDQKIINIASVHLKGYYPKETDLEKKQQSKLSGFKELQRYTTKLEDFSKETDGSIISGDFNEDITEKKYDLHRMGYLSNNGYNTDGNLDITEPSNKRRIDWLFYKNLKLEKATLTSLNLEKIQKQASDHLMTGTKITWN